MNRISRIARRESGERSARSVAGARVRLFSTAAALLLCAVALNWATPHMRAQSTLNPKRLDQNPLITVRSSSTLGGNVNGPSVIRVPDWIERPLGKGTTVLRESHGRLRSPGLCGRGRRPVADLRAWCPACARHRLLSRSARPDRDAGRFLHARRLSRDPSRSCTEAADHVGARLVDQRRTLAGRAGGGSRVGA